MEKICQAKNSHGKAEAAMPISDATAVKARARTKLLLETERDVKYPV